VPDCCVRPTFTTIPPGGTVKSFSELENTVGTVSCPTWSKGAAVLPWLAQIAFTGYPPLRHACPQSVTKRAPFDMPIPTSGVPGSSPVVATRCACSRPSRARSGLVVRDGSAAFQRWSPVRSVEEVDTNP
jgi:hypothetical protein